MDEGGAVVKGAVDPQASGKRIAAGAGQPWFPLLFAAVMLISTLGELAYRFSLPTDGWEVTEAGSVGLTYTANLLGLPSPLQRGDWLTAVAGVPVGAESIAADLPLRQSWRLGATLAYTVERQGQVITLPVTLGRWQLGAWLETFLGNPLKLGKLLSSLALASLSVFVLLRQPANPAAGAFLILMSLLTATGLSETLPLGLPVWVDPAARFLQARVIVLLLVVVFPYALIRFALSFPRPKPIYLRRPWLPAAAGGLGAVILLLTPGSILGWIYFLLSLALMIGILIHNALTMRDAVSRAQLRWGLSGVLFNFGLLTLALFASTLGLLPISNVYFNDFFNLINTLGMLLMGASLAVAITRYRLFDIDVIIRRTVQYALVSGLLALAYFGSVTILQSLFTALTGQQSPAALVLSTLAIAAIFNTLRRRVQDFIDRRFYRRKYDAEKALAEFAATARSEADLAQLSARLTSTVQDTMQPERVSVWIIRR